MTNAGQIFCTVWSWRRACVTIKTQAKCDRGRRHRGTCLLLLAGWCQRPEVASCRTTCDCRSTRPIRSQRRPECRRSQRCRCERRRCRWVRRALRRRGRRGWDSMRLLSSFTRIRRRTRRRIYCRIHRRIFHQRLAVVVAAARAAARVAQVLGRVLAVGVRAALKMAAKRSAARHPGGGPRARGGGVRGAREALGREERSGVAARAEVAEVERRRGRGERRRGGGYLRRRSISCGWAGGEHFKPPSPFPNLTRYPPPPLLIFLLPCGPP